MPSEDEANTDPHALAEQGRRPQRATLSEDEAVGRKFRLFAKISERPDVIVYDAEHTDIGRHVELHMLPIGLASDGPEANRLIHAARAGARVAHRHIRSVVDSGVDAFGRPFIVYEPLEGLACDAYVKSQGGALDVLAGAELTCQLLEALACAHGGGVVHRQVNAQNVVIADIPGAGPRVKLGGFGTAYLQHRPEHVPPLPAGYSRYYAPEVRRGEGTTDAAVDIYAAGVLMRLLLTGEERPGTPMPDVVARTVERATQEDAEQRFRSAEQFLAAVNMLLPTRERPAASVRPPGDPSAINLAADLRYLKRRRDGVVASDECTQAPPDLEFLPVLLIIEALYGMLGDAGWGQLATAVPGVVDLLPDANSGHDYASEGVASDLVASVLREADAVVGDGFLSLLQPVGASVAQRGLGRMCPELPDNLRARGLASAVPALWRALCRSGEVELQAMAERSARVAISEQRAPTLEISGLFASLLHEALRARAGSRAEHATVNLAACQALGDAADIYCLSW